MNGECRSAYKTSANDKSIRTSPSGGNVTRLVQYSTSVESLARTESRSKEPTIKLFEALEAF